MKTEVMAQFLVPGDIIMHERKKREIIFSKTKDSLTRIIFRGFKWQSCFNYY